MKNATDPIEQATTSSPESELFHGLLDLLAGASSEGAGLPGHKVLSAASLMLGVLVERGRIPSTSGVDERFVSELFELIDRVDDGVRGEGTYLHDMVATLHDILDLAADGDDDAGDPRTERAKLIGRRCC